MNRGLSLFPDSVLFANEMNLLPNLDKQMQYDFYMNILRKRRRFSKWPKKVSPENLELIQKVYKYSKEKALVALSILSDREIEILKEKYEVL